MATKTEIQWTDKTFNPWWGCTRVDKGCMNCYAERLDSRYHKANPHWGPKSERMPMSDRYWKQPIEWNKEAEKLGITYKVFCASMADVFEDHPALPFYREKLWKLIKATPNLTWQILTKRPENIKKMLPLDWSSGMVNYYPNVWLGTSVAENDNRYRIDQLTEIPAFVYFISCEPIISEVDLSPYLSKIDWVIVGGESGNATGKFRYRPAEITWFDKIVAQCKTKGKPVFVKQLGCHLAKKAGLAHHHGGDINEFPQNLRVRQFPVTYSPTTPAAYEGQKTIQEL